MVAVVVAHHTFHIEEPHVEEVGEVYDVASEHHKVQVEVVAGENTAAAVVAVDNTSFAAADVVAVGDDAQPYAVAVEVVEDDVVASAADVDVVHDGEEEEADDVAVEVE